MAHGQVMALPRHQTVSGLRSQQGKAEETAKKEGRTA
jgi:hypothetical protein